MSEYRTEFVIPPDRYVCLQLPSHLPEGKATITVTMHDPDSPDCADPVAADPGPGPHPDPDREDIEWWDEFEEGEGASGGERR